MRFTTVHINALVALLILLILAGGLIALVLIENGNMSDTRFLHVVAALGGIIWGVRSVALSFAGLPSRCRRCGSDLTTAEGEDN